MTTTSHNPHVALAERQSMPILTVLLIALLGYFSYVFQSSHNEIWISQNLFQSYKVFSLFSEQAYSQLGDILLKSNFVTVNIWQFVASIYFIFLFGMPVERRLGPSRFIFMIILAATLPWIVQFWDIMHNPTWPMAFEHPKLNIYFTGPAFIICALAGAYITVVPKKKMRELYVLKSNKGGVSEIFNRNVAQPVTEFYGLPAELFVFAFIVYECAQRAFIINSWKTLDTIGLCSALSALFIGWCLSSLVLASHQTTYDEHPLMRKAIKHYYELLDLDVNSENAIKGAAKAVGLPDEQVRTWVKQSKGRLRTD